VRYSAVYFAGFDFEAADHQHYWEQKMKNATCHNMAGEASALQMMVEQGLIHRLMPAPEPAAAAFDEYDPVCKIVCNEQGVCKVRSCSIALSSEFPVSSILSTNSEWTLDRSPRPRRGGFFGTERTSNTEDHSPPLYM